jgi:hypothetical protein
MSYKEFESKKYHIKYFKINPKPVVIINKKQTPDEYIEQTIEELIRIICNILHDEIFIKRGFKDENAERLFRLLIKKIYRRVFKGLK